MRSSPSAPAERVAFLRAQPFAHRGLHGRGIVENSRAAFRAAIKAGHGIECDVQPASDGTAFVFHDHDLDRLTAAKGPVAARAAAALDSIRLRGTRESLPRLPEMLALVGGRVPLLIEVKAKGRRIVPLCLSIRRALADYSGPAAVMSFNPLVARWFHDHSRETVRGLVVTEEGKKGWRGTIERALSLGRSKAEFLAYDIRDLPSEFADVARKRGRPVLTWTVRNDAARAVAAAHADQIIYERTA